MAEGALLHDQPGRRQQTRGNGKRITRPDIGDHKKVFLQISSLESDQSKYPYGFEHKRDDETYPPCGFASKDEVGTECGQ